MKLLPIILSGLFFHQPARAAVSLDTKGEDSVMLESDPAMKNLGKPEEGSPSGKAVAAFRAGRHAEAVALAEPLAAAGNADALHLLGFAHETGQGVPKSREKAMEHYERAAGKEHSDSVYRLAFLLMGSEEEADVRKARTMLEKHSAKDPEMAGRILGEAFLRGLLTEEPDPGSAILWWKKAADAGDLASMNFLARFHEGQMGFSEKRDAAKAMGFYRAAAEKGDATAMVNLASRLLAGEEKLRDEKKGREWISKAIDAGEPAAYLALGDYLEKEKKDPGAALAEYLKGASADQVDSMLRAANLLMKGAPGVEKDEKGGTGLLRKAAEAGSAQAHLELAGLMLNREKPDVLAGYAHLLNAAGAGLPLAQNELGIFYLSGSLGVADVSAAASWFGRAAQAGFASAQNNLAALHERGTGVPQNFQTAAQLYNLAAQQGHASATLALARFHAAGAGTEQNKEVAWALGKIADERGETNAAGFVMELEKELGKEELAKAKKELERLKSGRKRRVIDRK